MSKNRKSLAALFLYMNAALFGAGALLNVTGDLTTDYYSLSAAKGSADVQDETDYDGLEGALQGAVGVLSFMAAQSITHVRHEGNTVGVLLRLPFPIDIENYVQGPEQLEEMFRRHTKLLLDLIEGEIPRNARALITVDNLRFTHRAGYLDVKIYFSVIDLDRWVELKELISGELVEFCNGLFMEKIQNIAERLNGETDVSTAVRTVIEEQWGRHEARVERS